MPGKTYAGSFILSFLFVSVISSAFVLSPAISFAVLDNRPSNFSLNSPQYESYNPKEWFEIITNALQSIGATDIKLQGFYAQDSVFHTATGSGIFVNEDGSEIKILYQIQEYLPGTLRPDQHAYSPNTTFRTYSAEIREESFFWNMNGLYYSVVIGKKFGVEEQGFRFFADALYCAATGDTGECAPQAPPPSEPADQPGDLCAGVNCKNNYCSSDEMKFLYDCECEPEDGKCYCSSIDCPAGCDDALGGCIMQQSGDPNDLCAGVDCGSDYCLDDGKTRMHDCKCSPEDGQCYCYSEVCEAGCNMATGKCVQSMVILDDPDNASDGPNGDPLQSDDDGDRIYHDDSPDLLGTLGVIGGVAVGVGTVIGGGFFAIKALQGALAKRAVAKAAKTAAEPTLRELLAQAEQSADRASRALDSAVKASRTDQQAYKQFITRRTGFDEQWAQHMNDRAALIEKAEAGVKLVKKGADITADLLSNVPGSGSTFKTFYDYSTTAAESFASGDSVGELYLKSMGKAVENFAGNKLFGKVTTMKWLPTRMYNRSIKRAVIQVGKERLAVEGLKNEGVNYAMNTLKKMKSSTEFAGKIEKRVDTVMKRVDRKALGRMVKHVLYSK